MVRTLSKRRPDFMRPAPRWDTMRFTCDSCEARYTIADEKVRGRILRVRCKKCGSPILLKYEEPEEEVVESGDEDATRVMRQDDVRRAIETGAPSDTGVVARARAKAFSAPPPGERRDWYFLENAQELGPFSPSELTDKARDGRIQPRTYVWRDGMPQWARLHDVDELSSLLAVVASSSSAEAPEAETVARTPSPAARQAAVQDEEDDEDDDVHEQDERTEIGSFADLFPEEDALAAEAGEAGDEEGEQDDQEEVELGSALDADAFSGGDLSHLLSSGTKGPVVGGAAAREDPFASVPDSPSYEPPEPGETTNAIIKASGAKERHWGRLALAGVGLLAVVGAVVWFGGRSGVLVIPKVTQPRAEPAPTIDWSKVEALDDSAAGILSGESKRKEEEARRAAEQAARRRAADNDLAGLIPQDVDDRGAIKKVADDAPAMELSPQQQAQLARLRAERAAGGGPGTAGPRNFVDTGFDVKTTGASGPDQQAVARKVSEAQPAIGHCVSTALRRNPNQKVGKVVVVATIGSSGVVTRAEFREDRNAIATSELGDCVRKVVKGIIFPAFDGDPVDLEIPLVLGAG